MRYVYALILFASLPLSSAAQGGKLVERQQLAWLAYFSTLRFNEHWSLVSDVQERRFIAPHAQHQLLLRNVLARDLGSGWDIGPGLCFFLQSPQDPESDNDLVVPEIRPFVEANGRQRGKRIRIGHRYRAEARYFHRTAEGELVDGFEFGNFRLRYRLSVDVPLIKAKGGERELLTFKFADELHVNAGNGIVLNAFDQNRIFLGFQTTLSSSLSVGLSYLHWFQQRAAGDHYFERHIVRLSIHHRIDSARRKTEGAK